MEVHSAAVDVSIVHVGAHYKHGGRVEVREVVCAALKHLRIRPRLAAHAQPLVVAAGGRWR